MDKSKLVVVLTVAPGAATARAEAKVAEISLGVGGRATDGGVRNLVNQPAQSCTRRAR